MNLKILPIDSPASNKVSKLVRDKLEPLQDPKTSLQFFSVNKEEVVALSYGGIPFKLEFYLYDKAGYLIDSKTTSSEEEAFMSIIGKTHKELVESFISN